MFKIYGTIEQFQDMEPILQQAVHSLMISFIDICSLSIQLRESKRFAKASREAKLVLFNKDSPVKDEVDKFKRLLAAHNATQATHTLKSVLATRQDIVAFLEDANDTNRVVHELKNAEDLRKSATQGARYLQNIKSKLGLDDNALTGASKITYDELRRGCALGTASWFADEAKHPAFCAWADQTNAGADALFLITGGPNTGNSVIMSSVIHHLHSVYQSPENQAPRTLIAYHYFPNLTEKGDSAKASVETALKCIAAQFAEADPAFARRLSIKCDDKIRHGGGRALKDASCTELWDLMDLVSLRAHTLHYLVIDGLSEVQGEGRRQFLGLLKHLPSTASPTRVILSLRPDALDEVLELSVGCSKLNISEHTLNDIGVYIDRELAVNDILQFPDENSKRLRTKIKTQLSTGVKGNYFKVNVCLDKIKAVVAASGWEEEIDNALHEATVQDEALVSRTIIEDLEKTLTATEINELNELLKWVVFGCDDFTLEELNAALVS